MTRFALLFALVSQLALGRSAYQVYRMPSSGNVPSYGQVDISQSAAITGVLPIANGGTGSSTTVIVPTGAMLDFAGYTAPTGFLLCDGSTVSRSTYASLLTAITIAGNGTRTNSSAVITALADTSQMTAGQSVEGTGIPSSTTILSVDSSTQITLSASATSSGTSTVTVFPWGNGNGTTTFTLPDTRRKVAMGSGGSGSSTIGARLANAGGAETHTLTAAESGLPSHNHAVTDPGHTHLGKVGGNGGDNLANTGAWSTNNNGSYFNTQTMTTVTTGLTVNNVSSASASSAMSLVQPSFVVLKIIKT